MSVNERERRFKFLKVKGEHILALLGNWWHHDYITLPKIKGLPDGYRVEAIQSDWQADCFIMRIYHPSFDPIPDCVAIPHYDIIDGFEMVNMRQQTTAENVSMPASKLGGGTPAAIFMPEEMSRYAEDFRVAMGRSGGAIIPVVDIDAAKSSTITGGRKGVAQDAERKGWEFLGKP